MKKKMALIKIFCHLVHANYVMLKLLISNHTVFLIQFGINLPLRVLQKVAIVLAKAACAISAF